MKNFKIIKRESQLNRKTDTDFGQCHKEGHPNGPIGIQKMQSASSTGKC